MTSWVKVSSQQFHVLTKTSYLLTVSAKLCHRQFNEAVPTFWRNLYFEIQIMEMFVFCLLSSTIRLNYWHVLMVLFKSELLFAGILRGLPTGWRNYPLRHLPSCLPSLLPGSRTGRSSRGKMVLSPLRHQRSREPGCWRRRWTHGVLPHLQGRRRAAMLWQLPFKLPSCMLRAAAEGRAGRQLDLPALRGWAASGQGWKDFDLEMERGGRGSGRKEVWWCWAGGWVLKETG